MEKTLLAELRVKDRRYTLHKVRDGGVSWEIDLSPLGAERYTAFTTAWKAWERLETQLRKTVGVGL